MNVMTRTHADLAPRRIDQARLRVAIDLASLSVAPLWPLDGAIAVNPLTGFEELPFDEAIRVASTRFGARTGLPLSLWRRLGEKGRPGRAAVRDVAIAALGGINEAFRLLGPNVSRLDCLMARLFELPEAEEVPAIADPGAAAVADLCAAFFDPGTAGLALPRREGGLFVATRDLLAHTPGFASARLPHDLPERPVAAIATMLDRRGVSDAALDEYLGCTIAQLPGWAGHIRWRTDHADPDRVADAPATMADLIALLMLADHLADPPRMVERAADPAGTRAALAQYFGLSDQALGGIAEPVVTMSVTDLALIFQQAAETEYRDTLVRALRSTGPQRVASPAEATLVFCIDVRSEPMRRAIEATGPWDTAGYAGFFGLPIAIHADGMHRQRQLPVLVGPQHDLVMRPAPGEEVAAERTVQAQRRARWGSAMFGWLKGGSATAYATAEVTGPLAGFAMLAQTLFPGAMRRWQETWRGSDTPFAPAIDAHGGCGGLTLQERIDYARALFSLTGLDPQMAVIVLVGHRGEAVNNPFAASLDCGACAGHGGAPNARTLAAILNDPAVRAALDLPAHGFALAGEHNTTTDAVTLFGTADVPTQHRALVERLMRDLEQAGMNARTARARKLDRTADDLVRGAAHWGEVRPEWGLTGNAAFIVAPRDRTRAVDLDGRAFLHDYDWRSDLHGEALATILTAPMVVAQWINCQYLFSTIDNERYGAGDKAIHNPVARIGVMRGNGGDLAVGLPRQSLFHDDGLPAHIPQRLLTIVEAPLDRIDSVIAGHPVLQRLFGNGWVQLVAIDPATSEPRRWRANTELDSPDAWLSRPELESDQ